MILICRVVAQHVHVKTNALLDERQSNPSGANHGDSLASHFVTQKRQIRMPESPLVLACQMFRSPHPPRQRTHHEERKLGCGLREYVRGMRERNLVMIG